jgi:hypothetical protein
MGVKLLKRIQKLTFDLLFLCGCGVFVYGLWLAWRPLGFIVGGTVIAALAFFAGYQRPAQASVAHSAESEE